MLHSLAKKKKTEYKMLKLFFVCRKNIMGVSYV